MNHKNCYIFGNGDSSRKDKISDCPMCGPYEFDNHAHDDWEDFINLKKEKELYMGLLSHYVQAHHIRSKKTFSITSDLVKKITEKPNFPNPIAYRENIILYIGDECSKKGVGRLLLPGNMYIMAGGNKEFYLICMEDTIKNGFVLVTDHITEDLEERLIGLPPLVFENKIRSCYFGLSIEGWEHYEELKKGRSESNICFVARQFDNADLDEILGEIKSDLEKETGLHLKDLRGFTRSGIIDNIMRATIRNSAVVVADLSDGNQGAYWEAGFAEGLGKPVIYICNEDFFDENKTHFDTNHCTTVKWNIKNKDEFSRDLIATIKNSLVLSR